MNRRVTPSKLRGILAMVLIGIAAESASAHLCLVRQGRESAGSMQELNNYGGAVAAGDFNGDGFEDLVAGAIGDSTGGSIIVSFGCPTGITHVGAQRWTLGTLGFTELADSRFGSTLAVGDFNDDGFDDVAVGAPGYDGFRGAVVVIFGRATGLGPNVTWISEDNGPGAYEAGDNFGGALASGDFNNDGYDDLAVGAYTESLELQAGSIANAGSVTIFLGGIIGPFPPNGYIITEEDTSHHASISALFGFALAAGDINGDGRDDLVVGVPRKSNGTLLEDGAIHVFFGTTNGPTTVGSQYFAGASMTAPSLGNLDKFGYRLACGDGNGDGFADVAIGLPEADALGHVNAGLLYVMYGAASGLSLATKTSDYGSAVRDNDRFGDALAFGRYDASSDLLEELAVGAPSQSGTGQGGEVVVYQGRASGYSPSFTTVITQATLNEVVEPGDRFGASVAFGRFVGGQRRGLAVGAPSEDWDPLPGNPSPSINAAGAVSIDINWMQVQNLQCRAALMTNCSDEAVFSLKPFEPHLLASTSKIMTALVAIEATEPGCGVCTTMGSTYTHPELLCDNALPNSPNGTIGGSDSAMCPGETNSLQNLLWHMLFPSGNDAAFGIADLIINPGTTCADITCPDIFTFVGLMNAKAAELGMPDTLYENPSGAALPQWPSRNVSSPWDQARLAYFAMQNPTFYSYVSQPISPALPRSGGCWTPGSTSTWGSGVFTFPGGNGPDFANTSGLKPGGTPGAGNTLVVALDEPLGRMFGIILGEPSGTQMRTDMGAMLNLGRTTFCSGVFDPTPPAPGTVLKFPDKPSDGGKITHFAIPMQSEPDRGFDVRVTAAPGTHSAAGLLEINRERSMTLPAGDTTLSTITPFVSHQGVLITNLGEDRVDLMIHGGTSYAATATLMAGESHLVPPYAASSIEPEYVVSVANLSSTAPALISIEETRYAFETLVEDDGTSASARLTADRYEGEDSVQVFYTGLETDPTARVDILIADTLDLDPGCDGVLDVDDIAAFVEALISPASYEANYPACYIGSVDFNGDGKIDARDIAPFVALLLGE